MICGGKKIKDFSGTNPGPSHDLQGHWTIKFTITQLYSKKKYKRHFNIFLWSEPVCQVKFGNIKNY